MRCDCSIVALCCTCLAAAVLTGCGSQVSPNPAPKTSTPVATEPAKQQEKIASAKDVAAAEREVPDAAVLAVAPSNEPAAEAVDPNWGTLTGQFIYDGKAPQAQKINVAKEPACMPHNIKDESLIVGKDGGIKDVVVYLRTKNVKVNPALANPAGKVVLDNKNCRFEPHILPMLATQTLVIKNSDTFSHNSNIQEFGGNATNPILAGGAEATFKFGKTQNVPTEARCNIHPWMNAYIFARDNPYFTVSNEDGKFEIKDLPVGKLEFQVWQEKAGNFKDATIPGWKTGKFEMEIKPGSNDLGVIKFDPKLFNKK